MTDVVDAGVDLSAEDAAGGRSNLLLAVADRGRLERVLDLLGPALADAAPRRVAKVLADAACLVAHARVGWVLLPDLAVSVMGGPDARQVGSSVDPTRWAAVRRALRGRSAYDGDAPPGKPGPDRLTSDGRHLRAVVAQPVLAGDGTVLGALVLAHHRAHAFSSRRRSSAAALASHLGHAIALCESVAAQTRVATALQETLLPPLLPRIDGVEVAARYRPGGSGNLVGGDFYDVFADGARGWYVLLGDSSGIGPEAAGLAGVARYTARALAETEGGPTEMLAQMNRALLRAAPDDRFCSAVVAHFTTGDTPRLEVALASGGHPPPFVARARGGVAPALPSTGTLLGILPDPELGENIVTLAPGDAIVFYTDGVLEAQGPGGALFGEESLVPVLADACGRSAAGIARRVERAVADFRAADAHDDDLAVVVVRVGAGSGRQKFAGVAH